MYAFQVYLQILVPSDSRELPTTLMQLLAKMPKISQAKPQSLQKTKRKKTRWFRYKNDWQTMIKKQDHKIPPTR